MSTILKISVRITDSAYFQRIMHTYVHFTDETQRLQDVLRFLLNLVRYSLKQTASRCNPVNVMIFLT